MSGSVLEFLDDLPTQLDFILLSLDDDEDPTRLIKAMSDRFMRTGKLMETLPWETAAALLNQSVKLIRCNKKDQAATMILYLRKRIVSYAGLKHVDEIPEIFQKNIHARMKWVLENSLQKIPTILKSIPPAFSVAIVSGRAVTVEPKIDCHLLDQLIENIRVTSLELFVVESSSFSAKLFFSNILRRFIEVKENIVSNCCQEAVKCINEIDLLIKEFVAA
tara:strand:- start:188 stop:847 length:660 start_codon:yes stop_codon:yes gene_type:complete